MNPRTLKIYRVNTFQLYNARQLCPVLAELDKAMVLPPLRGPFATRRSGSRNPLFESGNGVLQRSSATTRQISNSAD